MSASTCGGTATSNPGVTNEAAQVAVECTCAASAFGDWTVFLTPTVLFLSVVAAIFGIRWNRRLARMRATLDVIERTESTEFYQSCHKVFRGRRMSGKGFDDLSHPENAPSEGVREKLEDERQKVLDYLNHFEIIALGIKRGILDKVFYHDWMYYVFARDWDAAAKFIQMERWHKKDGEWEYEEEIFENYQGLAIEWGAKENIDKDWMPPPADEPGEQSK